MALSLQFANWLSTSPDLKLALCAASVRDAPTIFGRLAPRRLIMLIREVSMRLGPVEEGPVLTDFELISFAESDDSLFIAVSISPKLEPS